MPQLPSLHAATTEARVPRVRALKPEKPPQREVLKKSVVNHPSSFFTKELPPPVHLSKPGEHMDVYVPVACHPGYFVIQPWQEIHKLEVLMEEMILYYSVSEERHVAVEKDQVYAAKVENK